MKIQKKWEQKAAGGQLHPVCLCREQLFVVQSWVVLGSPECLFPVNSLHITYSKNPLSGADGVTKLEFPPGHWRHNLVTDEILQHREYVSSL